MFITSEIHVYVMNIFLYYLFLTYMHVYAYSYFVHLQTTECDRPVMPLTFGTPYGGVHVRVFEPTIHVLYSLTGTVHFILSHQPLGLVLLHIL